MAEQMEQRRTTGWQGAGGREEARARVGKWNRISGQVRRWNGKLARHGGWEGTTFSKVTQIAGDSEVQTAVRRGHGLKEAVAEVCRRELERATVWFENADALPAEKLLAAMEEAVTEDAGGAMIRIFTALRQASVGGGRSDSKLTAVRMPREADGTRWRRMRAEENGRGERRERRVKGLVRKHGGELAMGEVRVPKEEWEEAGVQMEMGAFSAGSTA